MVARAWNFAMSKQDIVDSVAVVPPEVIEPFVTIFVDSNYNWNTLMRALFNATSNPDKVLY
jgi:hypothetical protein